MGGAVSDRRCFAAAFTLVVTESLDLHLSLPAAWFGFLSYKGAVVLRALREVRELYFPEVLPLLPEEEDGDEISSSSDDDRY